jgi:hypothetical protein
MADAQEETSATGPEVPVTGADQNRLVRNENVTMDTCQMYLVRSHGLEDAGCH